MIRLSHRILVVLVTVAATGCGFGGGSGGGGSIAPIGTAPVGSAAYLPTQVTRSSNYSFQVLYTPNQAAGGAITAIAVAPTSTDVWCGISPLGRVDHVDQNGPVAEASFVFDVLGFAVVGSNVYAGTANSIANRAGATYSRDPSGTWLLSLDGTLKEAVPLAFMNEVYSFQGENDGRSATVSHLTSSTGTWLEVASLGSMVPACATSFNGEAWVGGRTNNSTGGPARLLHGNGVTFTDMPINVQTFQGQIASVMALQQANGVLFVAVEVRDATTGTTVGGQLLYLDPVKGLTSVNQTQNDAVIALTQADGTVYAGTRTGKLLWLDTSGSWNSETGLPTNLGVTAVVWNGRELEVGVRSAQGAQLLVRHATGSTPPPPPGGVTFTSISPATGPVTGGTAVTIMGNNFATVTLVTIGGVPLTNLKVVSDVQITGMTPAGTAGKADVVITSTSKGSVTGTGAFTYPGATGPSYATDILPIINAQCVSCHFAGGQSPLNPYATLMSQTGVVVKGNVAGSLLAQKIATTGTMGVHVNAAQRTTIDNWIQSGANP